MPSGTGSSKSMLALLALAGAAEGIGGILESRANRKNQEQLTEQELKAREAEDLRRVAAAESLANPFRHQAAQGATAAALDRQERSTYKPVQVTPASAYAKYVPQVSGGFSYEKSPELVAASGALKRDVLAGHTAPTMTDPANYGKTAALNLDASGNPKGPTTGPVASGADRQTPADFMSYDRRGGSGSAGKQMAAGALTGAATGMNFGGPIGAGVGAGIGLLAGAVNKHAATAPKDFAVDDAREAIGRAIQYFQGRRATPQEIEQILVGQGWQAGDRWVGEGGLRSVLTAIAGDAA